MTREFSLERYRDILRKAQDQGYAFPKLSELGYAPLPKGRFLLIRHDIDVSVDAALEMAELERSCGVHASYYVRLHCPYYNVMDTEPLRKLLALKAMGHEIGLHYESLFYEELGLDVLEGIFKDVFILEKLLSLKITSVSQHNPSLGLIYPKIWEKYVDAYHPRFVKDMRYFGDSGRRWREGCVLEKIGVVDQLHVLIHPYAWTKWHADWEGNFRAHGLAAKDKLLGAMERNITLLRDYLARRDVLDAQRADRYSKTASG